MSYLAAIMEVHAAEAGELCIQTMLLLQLLPLHPLPHLPRLLDGFHHCILVPKQRCRVQTGQDVCQDPMQ